MAFKIKLLLFTLCLTGKITAQKQNDPGKQKKELGITVSPGLSLPVDVFEQTHFIGAAVEISPSSHTFRLFKPGFAFTYNGGFTYYFGKKETVSGYPYKYPAYSIAYASAGVLYLLKQNSDLRLTAGPAVSFYNGLNRFCLTGKLEYCYFVPGTVSIRPSVMLIKENGANTLWSASVKAGIEF